MVKLAEYHVEVNIISSMIFFHFTVILLERNSSLCFIFTQENIGFFIAYYFLAKLSVLSLYDRNTK